MNEQIYLIEQGSVSDSIGQWIGTDAGIYPVWARVKSISRAEWSAAGQNGLDSKLVVVVHDLDYKGQDVVQIGTGACAKRYTVYRTYKPDNTDHIELYLAKMVVGA